MFIATITWLTRHEISLSQMTTWYIPFIVITMRPSPHLWLVTGFVSRVTWRVLLVEQELLSLSELLISPRFFCEVRVAAEILVFSVMFSLSFVIFLLTILLSACLRFTASAYPFSIFMYFTTKQNKPGLPFTCFFLAWFTFLLIFFLITIKSKYQWNIVKTS